MLLPCVTVKLSQIALEEKCHKKAFENGKLPDRLASNPLCIVRRDYNSTEKPYVLVTGWASYMTALLNEQDYIKAIVVSDKSRKDFLRGLDFTFEMWETSRIKPPKDWTAPSPSKIKDCVSRYKAVGVFGKPVFISPKGTILDGYSAVAAAKVLGLEKIPVNVMEPTRWKHKKRD